MTNAMLNKLGFSKEEYNCVLKIIASILLIGNIDFDDAE